MASPNRPNWRHYRASLSNAELMIELADLAEFLRFAEDHRISSIYCFVNNDEVESFGTSHKGGLFMVKAKGFRELSDYCMASERGFPDASSFYEAQAKGFSSYEAYILSKGSELSDPETYAILVAQGYQDGFETYTKLLENEQVPKSLLGLRNSYELYSRGTKAGFSNWFEMQAAMEHGFDTAHRYRASKEFGVEKASDYEAAQLGGFISGKEWNEAQTHGCSSRLELVAMESLNIMAANDLKHDARVLLSLLARLPEKRELTVDRLQQLLEKELALFQDPETRMFRNWFTHQLRDRSTLLTFLRKEEMVKQFGTFHHDKEVFVSHAMQARHVVIDASNVAHNSQVDPKAQPKVLHLQLMIAYLKEHGFQDIAVIADASLKHKIDDREALQEFASKVNYRETPAKQSADLDILFYVKTHNCLLVSNDQFRDWKQIDPWIEDNIASYRLPFKIHDGKVLIAGMGK